MIALHVAVQEPPKERGELVDACRLLLADLARVGLIAAPAAIGVVLCDGVGWSGVGRVARSVTPNHCLALWGAEMRELKAAPYLNLQPAGCSSQANRMQASCSHSQN